MQDPKIAFVGCGHIAHVHMRYLKKMGREVHAICDASALRATDFAAQYDIANCESDITVMLATHKPDTVHVLVPPHVHFSIVKQCLEHGCHVIVEKPICESVAEFEELQALAEKNNLLLSVDHTRVYNPMLIKAREHLKNGTYGEIVRMEYHYDDPSTKKTEDPNFPVAYVRGSPPWFQKLKGGVIADLLPHPISVMLSIVPELKLGNVYGKASGGIIEEVIARLESPSTDALMILSMNSKPLQNELKIFCERGTISIDLRNLYNIYLPARNMPGIVARVLDTFSVSFQTQFRFIGSISKIILGRKHPYDGLDVIFEKFYKNVEAGDSSAIELLNAGEVVQISQKIVESIIKPGKFASDIDAKLFKKLKARTEQEAEILVTGGTGFIGSALVEELVAQGESVRALSRSARSASKLPKIVGLKFGDMRDQAAVDDALSGVTTIYHCAAAMQGDWAEFYTSTVEGTRVLLNSLRGSSVKHLVYLSSLGVMDYQLARNGRELTESSAVERFPDRRGFYTKAKKEAEDLVLQFIEENPDIKVTVVRPGLVYGKESNNNLNNAGVLLGGLLVCFGIGRRYFGLSYVKNLAQTLAALRNFEGQLESGNILHVTDDEQPTVRQYLRMHNARSEKRVRVIYVPILVWRLVFKIVDTLLTLIRKKNPDFSYRFNSNAKRLIYRANNLETHPELKGEYTLEQALNETIK